MWRYSVIGDLRNRLMRFVAIAALRIDDGILGLSMANEPRGRSKVAHDICLMVCPPQPFPHLTETLRRAGTSASAIG